MIRIRICLHKVHMLFVRMTKEHLAMKQAGYLNKTEDLKLQGKHW